jgi:hypothetical protein
MKRYLKNSPVVIASEPAPFYGAFFATAAISSEEKSRLLHFVRNDKSGVKALFQRSL